MGKNDHCREGSGGQGKREWWAAQVGNRAAKIEGGKKPSPGKEHEHPAKKRVT